MNFVDGASPPPEIISDWYELVTSTFDSPSAKTEKPCIAVHCVAGLGRYEIYL